MTPPTRGTSHYPPGGLHTTHPEDFTPPTRRKSHHPPENFTPPTRRTSHYPPTSQNPPPHPHTSRCQPLLFRWFNPHHTHTHTPHCRPRPPVQMFETFLEKTCERYADYFEDIQAILKASIWHPPGKRLCICAHPRTRIHPHPPAKRLHMRTHTLSHGRTHAPGEQLHVRTGTHAQPQARARTRIHSRTRTHKYAFLFIPAPALCRSGTTLSKQLRRTFTCESRRRRSRR